ncbi:MULTISPECIES: VOC family protein [Glaesserella]|uniref:Metalloprotein n=1 Tax=Glaesserella australis TaxID=2094024 RepID=A0A328C304_9PAST|nr:MULTISPECIES: VOC family protein [Glaesserella]AUI66346.1 metalloprotein [Glaesserella sp. 15-184]RAL19440.1 metalloprotein [Glaesserella australis]
MILKNTDKSSEFANFFTNLTACFGDLAVFEQKIQQIAEIAKIDLSRYQIDHLAVRMNSNELAEQWRALLLNGSTLLKESEVNGRPIGLFTLNQPLNFCGQQVSVIELPFPKGKIYAEQGWEHIELVVPMLENESVEDWCKRIDSHFSLQNNPELKVKFSQPQVNGERLPNPSVAISLKNATYRNFCCLKLHPYDINTIVCSESNL